MRIVKNTISEGIKNVTEKMRDNAKVGVERSLVVLRNSVAPLTPVRTSRLRGSIMKMGLGADEGIFEVEQTKEGVNGVLGSNVPYSIYVELGTSKQAPQYYMTNGFEQAQKDMEKVILVAMQI